MIADTLGSALDQALKDAEASGKEFKVEAEGQDTRLVLCAISSHREPQQIGKLTLNAARREHGYIVLGPLASRHSHEMTREEIMSFTKVRRWVLNKTLIGDGISSDPSVIKGLPSIVLMTKVRLTCQTCGHSHVEWRDTAMSRMKRSRGSGMTCRNKVGEAVCGSPDMVMESMRTELFNPTGDPLVDAVFKAEETAVVEAMIDTWKAGLPKTGQATVNLPRVWCVYPRIAMPPVEWSPTDKRSALISERAAAYAEIRTEGTKMVRKEYPLGILPFGAARKFHTGPVPENKVLVGCWLDVPELEVGWVQMQDLMANPDGGFKRQLWYDVEPGKARRRGYKGVAKTPVV